MASNFIMTVILDKRSDIAPDVQQILTEYGCIISARIGLHQVDNCTEDGLIILHLRGENGEINELETKLKAIEKVRVKKMEI